MASVLYLSYDGMTDPLGRSQVLPYLQKLSSRGHRIRLVSLEKPALLAAERTTVQDICDNAGIEWHPRPFRSGFLPIAVPRNLATMGKAGATLLKRQASDIIHCRSDLPGMVGLQLQQRFGGALLYDMRAFWPDERAEGGAWDQRRWLYRAVFRTFKEVQARLIRSADHIVALAGAGVEELPALVPGGAVPPVTVIPCCADFAHFHLRDAAERASRRADLGIAEEAPLLIHLGTLGPNAMAAEMIDFLAAFRQHSQTACLLLLDPTGGASGRQAAAERGLSGAVFVRSATREDVPSWLSAADLGLFFVRPSWAKKAASPTKMAELLASGLPVVANSGVGDVAEIVRDCRAGVVVDGFDAESLHQAATTAARLATSPEAIRTAARRWFDLGQGVARYDAIYRSLTRS